MMTNDKKTIKEITGLDIGKVYFENSETDELDDMTPILFDKSSGNFVNGRIRVPFYSLQVMP